MIFFLPAYFNDFCLVFVFQLLWPGYYLDSEKKKEEVNRNYIFICTRAWSLLPKKLHLKDSVLRRGKRI